MKFTPEHFGLPARDPVALKNWYMTMLGSELVFDDHEQPPAFLLRFAGGQMIEIYQSNFALKETADNKLAGWRHLALRVDSVAAARAELEKRGVKFIEATRSATGGGNVAYFVDPEGNLLHLVERPADSILRR